MTEPHSSPESRDEGGAPRWVKVFGGVVLLVVVLFVSVHLAGGGMVGHTP
ncbi:hypothetical protein [Streptomyces pristinaespiralis]